MRQSLRFCFFRYPLIPAVTLLWLLSGCAGQRAPEGGPVDTEPPQIVSVYPAPNTVNFRDRRIALEFSEYVDRASVEKAVFISPYVADVEYEWSGHEVEIVFPEGLKANTTYVLTLGTDVVDMHNRNRMASAFTLAFSTGPAIDRGAIAGRVVDPKSEGVMLFAYRLDEINADTLNPEKTSPDYITQTGTLGTYGLSHLRLGTYRVLAVRDEYRDLLYTPEVDAAGALTHDLRLSEADTLASGCDFTLALEDTSSPRLLSVEARDKRHLVLRFSEPLDTALSHPLVTALDTSSGRPLEVTHAFIEDAASPVAVVARTESQETGASYRVTVAAVFDRAGHPIRPGFNTLGVAASERPDTLSPALVSGTLRDTMQAIGTDARFRFDFSDILSGSILHAFRFRLGDSTDAPFRLEPTTAGSGIVLVPQSTLRQKSRYTIRLRMDSVRSLSGSALKDSVRIFRYTTIDPENFSSIEGRVEASALSDTSLTILEAYQTKADKTVSAPARVSVKKDRSFIFPMLGEGNYGLRAFSDYNRNGRLDAGRVYPFMPSEPFVVGRDTVKLRARWPVEGVLVR